MSCKTLNYNDNYHYAVRLGEICRLGLFSHAHHCLVLDQAKNSTAIVRKL